MTITLTREEAEHVLKLLDKFDTFNDFTDVREPLRAKLSEPEPEPVAWTVGGLITDFSRDFSAYKTKTYTQPLYTTPPQRKPEPKPVAWLNKLGNGAWIADVLKCEGDEPSEPLYTAPPQREELRRLHEVNAELVEALREVRRDVRHMLKGHFVQLKDVEKELSAAIAKATGEQQ